MDKLTGVDVARKIRERDSNVKIVFSTTSNEFASESYEVNACYYLRKPFGRDKVKVMLDRLNLAEIEKMRTVKLPDGTSAILRNIIYVDFSSHRVTLHCKYDVDTIVRTSFSEIESLLCAYPYFSSPTKGMLINFYEVAFFDKNNIFFDCSCDNFATFSRCMGCLCSRKQHRNHQCSKHHPVCCFLFSCHKKTLWQNVFYTFNDFKSCEPRCNFIKDHRKSFLP